MLLRASSEAIAQDVDLSATVGQGGGGIPDGEALVAFAEAATRGSDELGAARSALLEAVGPEAFVEAAATVGIFNGLVRTADATGIPLDDGTRNATTRVRAELGLNDFGGAANTDIGRDGDSESEGDVRQLFS